MKEFNTTKIAVIAETDPEEFQTKVNNMLKDLDNIQAIDYKNGEPGRYSVIITYIEHREEPDKSSELYAAEGKHYLCNDCPHLEMDPDRRSTTHYCRQFKDRVKLSDPACEHFLTALREGREHLVTPEERRAEFERMDREAEERRRKQINQANKLCQQRKNLLKIEKELKKLENE